MDLLKERGQYILSRLNQSHIWAITPEAISALVFAALNPLVIRGGCFTTWEAAKPHSLGKGPSKVAVIPIQGVLTSDGPSWLGSNYMSIADAAEQAAADPTVKRIVLSVDSPGGEVTGAPETAAVIAQVAKVKAVSAIVEGTAASAAYWLASQAHDITVTPSGHVGSVGVKATHMDVSKALEDAGVKVTEMQAGQYKTEWSPYKPLTDEAKADMQRRMDATHQYFLTAINNGRGMRTTAEMRTARYGEGRVFSAPDAHAGGLVDHIQASRDFYRGIAPTAEDVQAPAKFGLTATAHIQLAKARAKF